MRKISLLVAAASLAFAGAASAADMGAARPVYTKAAPVAVWSWTGSYIGGFVGGAGSTNNFTNTDPFGASITAGYGLGSGFTGGYTSGYNWQIAPNWLIGYEGETGYINLKGNGASAVAPNFGASQIGSFYNTWTGRVGYVADRSLFYAKGGVVLARFDTGVFVGPAATTGFQSHKYELGYAVGGGWEYAFDPKWSIKAEYEYLGFDKDFTYTGGALASTSHFGGIHTGKVGLNYKWDWFGFLR